MFSRFRKAPWGRIVATPNPIPIAHEANIGVTTLRWKTHGVKTIEVRLGSPNGPVVCRGGPRGEHTTGNWVANGARFYLQNAAATEPLGFSSTLADVRIHLAAPRFTPPLSADTANPRADLLRMNEATSREAGGPKALVTGYFSYEGGPTAGDLVALDIACQWLKEAGRSYDVARAAPAAEGIRLEKVDASLYSHLLFVCGPFVKWGGPLDLITRFKKLRKVGLNLSIPKATEDWDPFDFLLARDSPQESRPDLAFLSTKPRVPVVGLIRVEPQHLPGYREGAQHEVVNDAIRKLLASREMSIVEIDTRLPVNTTGLRTPSEVESLIARMDLVITTRLHGLVFALKNGVPAIAMDNFPGGDKVLRQAKTVGWPLLFTSDQLEAREWNDELLVQAFDYALTAQAKELAKECAIKAVRDLAVVHNAFVAEFDMRHGNAEPSIASAAQARASD